MKTTVAFILIIAIGCKAFTAPKLAAGSSSTKFLTRMWSATSPQADEAVAIFDKKYPFNRPPPKADELLKLGMPNSDIDGSKIFKSNSEGGSKRLVDIDEETARAVFAEIAKNYGTDEALDMVKAMPICLAFNKDRFGPALKAFGETFGYEEAQKMVQRNPGLLVCSEKDAKAATDSTMVFSYLIGFTRPLGPLLLAMLFSALLVPVVEGVTGIPIHAAIFGQ